MNDRPGFRFEQQGPTGGIIFDGDDPIAEIRDLRMCRVKPKRDGQVMIGEDVPLPLYWEQYADHQHPERNAGSHGRLDCVLESLSRISLKIESASHSREVTSQYLVDVLYSEELGSYVFDIKCRLTVPDGKTWLVTHNPSHGELEFCNFWPNGVFVANVDQPSGRHNPDSNRAAKRYQACYLQKADRVECIPHHHLETSDKHNISMAERDRLLYLLEDDNPVIEICGSGNVTAGLCAYMWDAHLAYRVCKHGTDVELPGGSVFDAHFRFYAMGRADGERVAAVATARPAPELGTIPIYVDGLNTFTDSASAEDSGDVWPWEHGEEIPGVIEYCRDLTEGYSDDSSVRIRALRPSTGRWMATTLGPAFGGATFENGRRYRLSGFVKTKELDGRARIGIRLHRTGIGDVFDLETYETHHSADSATGSSDWTAISVTTPVIDPAPDRVHLLLEIDGVGTCWFDDVIFQQNV
ncbi:MAG: hypothetical protein R2832_13355 [Rhodothermales bacterium]